MTWKVKILNKAVCLSKRTYIFLKGMNPIIPAPGMDK